MSGVSPCAVRAAWDPPDTAGDGHTVHDSRAAWGQTCAGPWGSVPPWDGAADSRPEGTLPSGAREPRGTEGVAVACGVAPAGRRDRAGAAAPWSVSSWSAAGRGTSWVAAAGSTSSWRSVAAVLAACRREGGAGRHRQAKVGEA